MLCLDCVFAAPEFVLDATLYDSLPRRTRQINPDIVLIATEVNVFLHNFVLYDDPHERLRTDAETFLQLLQYSECPGQLKGYDCGLFRCERCPAPCRGEGNCKRNVQSTTHQRASSKIGVIFSGVDNVLQTTSQVVCKCFPKLSGSSILESKTGVEMISAPSRQLCSGRYGVDLAAATATTACRLRWETDAKDAVTVLTKLLELKTRNSARRDVATLVEGNVKTKVKTRTSARRDFAMLVEDKVETKTFLKGSVIKLVPLSASDNTAGSAFSSAHDMESDNDEDSDEHGVEEECDNVTESLTMTGSGNK